VKNLGKLCKRDNMERKLHKIKKRVGKNEKGKKNKEKGEISENLWKISGLCKGKTGKEGYEG
jgi:hypothetical protein